MHATAEGQTPPPHQPRENKKQKKKKEKEKNRKKHKNKNKNSETARFNPYQVTLRGSRSTTRHRDHEPVATKTKQRKPTTLKRRAQKQTLAPPAHPPTLVFFERREAPPTKNSSSATQNPNHPQCSTSRRGTARHLPRQCPAGSGGRATLGP